MTLDKQVAIAEDLQAEGGEKRVSRNLDLEMCGSGTPWREGFQLSAGLRSHHQQEQGLWAGIYALTLYIRC